MVGKVAEITGAVHDTVVRTRTRTSLATMPADPAALGLRIGGALGLGALGLVAGTAGSPVACALAVGAGLTVALDVPRRLGRVRRPRS